MHGIDAMSLPDDLRAAAGGVDRRCKVPRRRRTTLGPVSVEMLIKAADELDRLHEEVEWSRSELTEWVRKEAARLAEIERLQARTAALESHLRWIAEWADRHAYQAMARRIEQMLADH